MRSTHPVVDGRSAQLLVRLVVGHPVAMVVAGLVLVALAAVPAGRLRLQTEVVDLLPKGSRAAADYRLMLERFGGFERVFVVVESPDINDTERVAAAAEHLASILEASPLLRSVRSGISPEDEEFILTFVVQRSLLIMGDDWRERLEDAVRPAALRARAAEIRSAMVSPAGFLTVEMAKADPLGLTEAWRATEATSMAVAVDPMTMTFVSVDGRASLVILTPSTSDMSPTKGRQLRGELERAFAEVGTGGNADLRFWAVGGPLYAAADEALIKDDLKRTVTSSALGCLVLMVLAFGGLAVPAAILVAVGAAVALTAGVLALTLGEVSALSAGFAAVLVGLGIDYGIHGCVRFRQALLDRGTAEAAVRCVFSEAGPAIVSSAVTTVVAFAVLTLAVLKPLRDLGVIGAVGILMILAATVLLGPPVVVAASRGSVGQRESGTLWEAVGTGVDRMVRAAVTKPVLVLACATVLTAVAAVGLMRVQIHTDLRSVRPAHHPMLEAERALDRTFGLGAGTGSVVVPGETLDQALERAGAVARLLSNELGTSGHVTYPDGVLGALRDTHERLSEVGEVQLEPALEQLDREMRRVGLDPAGFAAGFRALRALDAGRDPAAPAPASWPSWLHQTIRIDPDGAWVMIPVRHDDNVWVKGPPEDFVARIEVVAPGSAVASVPAIGRDLERLSRRDLNRLGLATLGAVLAVVVLSFRGSLRAALLALVPVLLGSIWVFGVWGWMGYSLDVVAIAVLPLMIGIGIDDGLHAVHGVRRGTGENGLAASIRGAGRAMVLTTLTTCVGFGSLGFSDIPGLRNGGLLVAVGVTFCLCATLVVLPAIGQLRTGRRA